MPRILRVASIDEIPAGHGKLVRLDGVELAVFNAGSGRYYASSPLCPHEDGPLAEGAVLGDVVICPWHGFDFDLRTGACQLDAELRLTVYPVRIEGTDLLVELP